MNEWGLWRWRRPSTVPTGLTSNEGELVYEAVRQVLQETGLKFAQDGTGIDATITCSQDHWDGRTISNCNVMSYVGAHHSDEDKVAEDSLNCGLCRLCPGPLGTSGCGPGGYPLQGIPGRQVGH